MKKNDKLIFETYVQCAYGKINEAKKPVKENDDEDVDDKAKEVVDEDEESGKVESEKDLDDMAMALAKKIHDDVDEDIVKGVVKKAIEDNTKDGVTDWKAAAGAVTGMYTAN